MTHDDKTLLRAWRRSARAAWWKRALWGRYDVYDPRLRLWRALRVLWLAVAVVLASVPYSQPFTRAGMCVWCAIGLAAIVERWRALRPKD